MVMDFLKEPLSRQTIIFSLLAALLAFGAGAAVYLSMHSVPSSTAYAMARGELQNAVIDYKLHHSVNTLPVSNNGTTIFMGGKQFYLIDGCALLESEGGILKKLPEGFARVAGDGNDNCDSGNCSCNPKGHYVWFVNPNGGICSICVGGGCKAKMADGDQGVWP